MSSASARIAAWAVHALTASGAVWGVLALMSIADGRLRSALMWMSLAVAVDAVDGALARLADVRARLPFIDGALLDNIVDYLNYAIVPAVLVLSTDLLPDRLALIGAAAICISSAFQFVHSEAKADGQFFRGFPSYWNIAAFYAIVLEPPGGVAFAILIALAVLAFAPIRFLYPSRTRLYRGLTVTLTVAWAASLLVVLAMFPAPPRWLTLGSLSYVVYYVGMSLHVARRI